MRTRSRNLPAAPVIRRRHSLMPSVRRSIAASIEGAPPHVAGDYPEWLDPYFARVFGSERAEEAAALGSRAPLDLRVNTLKTDRDAAAASLADLAPEPTRWSPYGLRVRLKADAKSPAVHAEPAFLKGQIEVQDEGSQLAALFAARAGPASRCWTFAPAAAARRWRWRPRWKTRASSTPPTTTSAALRRSTTGWRAPARATSRCARRSRSAPRSTISRAAWISC